MSERQDSRPTRHGTGSSDPAKLAQRQALDKIKPPREWRSGRATPKAPAAAAVPPALPDPPKAADNPALVGASDSLVREISPEPSAPYQEPVPELPELYYEDRLVLLVRDPWWAYAWWEVTDPTFAQARQQSGDRTRLVLRVYNVTQIDWDGTNHHECMDIDVHGAASNWFLELAQPGDSFCAELGLLSESGEFLPMVRSNAITLPPDRVSTVIDEEWMIPDEDWERMFALAGGGVTMGVGSGEVLRMMEGRMHSDMSSGGLVGSSVPRPEERG